MNIGNERNITKDQIKVNTFTGTNFTFLGNQSVYLIAIASNNSPKIVFSYTYFNYPLFDGNDTNNTDPPKPPYDCDDPANL